MLLLLLTVDGCRCGIDSRRVVEVVPAVELDEAQPGFPGSCGGIVRRGEFLPVYDLEKILGSGEPANRLSRRIIFVSALLPPGPAAAGLLAGGVTEAARVDDAKIIRASLEDLRPNGAEAGVRLLDLEDVLRRCNFPNV